MISGFMISGRRHCGQSKVRLFTTAMHEGISTRGTRKDRGTILARTEFLDFLRGYWISPAPAGI